MGVSVPVLGLPDLLDGGELPTFYVATTGNDTTGDGSSELPWLTVQHALDTVSADDTGNVKIAVLPGTYNEGTYLNVAREFDETVIVTGIGSVTIQGNGTLVMSTLIGVAKNIRFEGLTFENNGSARTVYFNQNVVGIDSIQFHDCAINNDTASGFAIKMRNSGAANCSFSSCILTSTGADGRCVEINGKSDDWIDYLTFSNCTMTGNTFGINIMNDARVRHLSVQGGSYNTVAIGGACIGMDDEAASATLSNITIANATLTAAGEGIVFGGSVGNVIDTLTISNCIVDATANDEVGVRIVDYVDSFTVERGTYIGGDVGGGYGGIATVGENITNIALLNANIASHATGPLAAGLSGDGITVTGCYFYGPGRGLSLQNNAWNVVVTDCVSDAEDMGLRCGHDGGVPYTSGNITVTNFVINAIDSPGMTIGLGLSNVSISGCTVEGKTALKMRGHTDNTDISITGNTFAHADDATGSDPLLLLYGIVNATITGNTFTSKRDIAIRVLLQDAQQVQDSTITGNTINLTGTTTGLYNVDVGSIGTGNDIDYQTLVGGVGTSSILGISAATLAEIQSAWDTSGFNAYDNNTTN